MSSYNTTKNYFFLFIIIVFISITVKVFIDIEKNRLNAANGYSLWLGIETMELTPSIISQYNIHSDSGLLVTRTFIGSPAEVAGIQQGDILRRWNGISITSQNQLQKLISKASAKSRIKLSIDRNGKPILSYVVLGIRPGKF